VPINRTQLQQVAQLRLDEAEALLLANHPSGAYYLAGYAVECALKACIAKQTREHDFPEKDVVNSSYTHNLKALLSVAGLEQDLRSAEADKGFALNWVIVTTWKEDSRYATHSALEAENLLLAISDKSRGVLQWIKKYW
jgi:HEPN domain-containing protein